MKKEHNLEYQFHNYFIEKHEKLLRGCQLLNHEVSLVDPYSVLSKDFPTSVGNKPRLFKCWGRIDFVIKYRGELLVVELKYPHISNSEFWDALKVVGYCAYYNFQMEANAFPAIMMPHHCFKLEHQIVASKLHLRLFGIEKDGSLFKVKKLN